MIRILIAENIPGLNKGEMAIYGGMLEIFKTLGDFKVAMLSNSTAVDRERYDNVEIIDISKSLYISSETRGPFIKLIVSVWALIQHLVFLILYKFSGQRVLSVFRQQIWRVYVDADLVIIGHNGAFGIGGGLGAPLYLMPIYIPLMAKFMGKPVVIFGGSIPRPIKLKRMVSAIFRSVINKIDLVTLREAKSFENLKELGARTDHVYVLPDLAFLLPPADFCRGEEILTEQGINREHGPLIGFTFTRQIASHACSELDNTEEKYRYHTEMMATVTDAIIEQLNATVLFIPHCIGIAKDLDDRLVGEDIFNLCKNKEKVKLITKEYDPKELKALVGQCDLFIGERLHSVIGALSMCVPSLVVSFANDQRLEIIKDACDESFICHVEKLDAKSLLDRIKGLWIKKEDVSRQLNNKKGSIYERAMKNGELLRRVLSKYM
jgi:polysaccharide pyruvyl transferase WcaK-like protein